MNNATSCTWEGCREFAQVKQKNSNGEVWANLCVGHNARFEVDYTNLRPTGLLRDWIKAQGGSKVLSGRISKQIIGE